MQSIRTYTNLTEYNPLTKEIISFMCQQKYWL